jgi:hypothetical protein
MGVETVSSQLSGAHDGIHSGHGTSKAGGRLLPSGNTNVVLP